jgi:hypothetical protein
MKNNRLKFAAGRNLLRRNHIRARNRRPRTSREQAYKSDHQPIRGPVSRVPPDAHPVESMKSERWKVKAKRSQESESRSQEDVPPRLAVIVLILVVVLVLDCNVKQARWVYSSRKQFRRWFEMLSPRVVSHLESPLFSREVPPTLWRVTTRKSRASRGDASS